MSPDDHISVRDWRCKPPLRLRVAKKLDIHWCWIKCNRCPHMRAVAIAPYIIRWGPDGWQDMLRRAGRCTRCGKRGVELQHPSWGGSDSGWAPMADQPDGTNAAVKCRKPNRRLSGFGTLSKKFNRLSQKYTLTLIKSELSITAIGRGGLPSHLTEVIMTKPAPLAVISSLPVILGCALLGAMEARAVPFEVTIEPGAAPNTVVATSNGGEIDTNGLTNTFPFAAGPNTIWPSTGRLVIGSNTMVDRYTVNQGTFAGPATFGTGGRVDSTVGTGDSLAILRANAAAGVPVDVLWLPAGYISETPVGIGSTATFAGTLSSLGLTFGAETLTWGGAQSPDQSFTIRVVPGPIVGAGLPGLIAALGGLVAMARRRRKQLA